LSFTNLLLLAHHNYFRTKSRPKRRVPLVEQELLTLPEHPGS